MSQIKQIRDEISIREAEHNNLMRTINSRFNDCTSLNPKCELNAKNCVNSQDLRDFSLAKGGIVRLIEKRMELQKEL